MADEGRSFLVALNRNLTDATALGGELPENLRAAADSYSQGQVDGLLGDKAPINNPTFTGTVGGITKSMVGLGNVDNTSDANKPISSATQAALDDKLDADETLLPVTTSGWSEIRAVTAAGASVRITDITVTPAKYGCAGNGTTDDTTNLNTMITAVRNLISSSRVRVKIDLNGGTYKVTGNGLNMSGMRAWNLEVCNGVILGHTTGKPVIDLVGSRGYVFRNVLVYGDATDTPTVPFLCARGTLTADGFCDNNLFDNVTTIGYWSVAAFYAYGQETTTHLHCRYWNSHPEASVAIFEGYDSHPQTSVNKTVLTGGASHINNVYINIDFRYQPVSGVDRATITGISKANPAVVTCSGGHPFVNGDTVIIAHIEAGMTQINSKEAVVANATATTFEMTGINSSGYSTYTTGGYALRRNTKPAIYMNRMKQHRFIGCYVVSYSEDAIEYAFPDGSRLEQSTFDFLQEGAASRSIWRWSGVSTSTINTYSNEFRGYSTHCGGAYFSTDATGAGRIVAYDTTINDPSHVHQPTNMPLVTTGSEGLFVFYGARISWYSRAGVLMGSYGGSSNGTVFAVSDGKTEVWGAFPKSVSTGSFTPTVAATSGTITTLGTVSGYAFYLGDMVWVEYSIAITTNGTGASALTATLPATAATGAVSVLNGRSIAVGGQQLQGRIASGGTVVTIWTDDNTYPGADGETIVLSGWYRRA